VRSPANPPGHSAASGTTEAQARERQAAARLGALGSGKVTRELGLRLLGLIRTLLTEADEQEAMHIKGLLTSLVSAPSLVSVLGRAMALIMAGVAAETAAVELSC
jgi:hypothetical protein